MAKKTRAELQAIVIYLEHELEEAKKRLQLYEQHFKSCCTALPISPPPDHHHKETSVRRTLEEPPAKDRSSTNTTASTQHTKEHSNPSTLKDHEASNLHTASDTSDRQVPGTKKRKQWETHACLLVAKFKRKRSEGRPLKSSYEAIISSIIHGTGCDAQALLVNPSMDPIAAVERYASTTRGSRERAGLASRVSSFQNLVFHSVCVVLGYCGYPDEDIDRIMRIRSSDSGAKNLKRLRSGAEWANEVISESTNGEWTGTSDCIAELYFYHDIKMSLYGSLADSRAQSILYVVQGVSQVQLEAMPLPWCIPAFVKMVLPAPEITPEKICKALKYNESAAQRVKNIVSEYQYGINKFLQSQADLLHELWQRERLLESSMIGLPPRPSKTPPPIRDGQETDKVASVAESSSPAASARDMGILTTRDESTLCDAALGEIAEAGAQSSHLQIDSDNTRLMEDEESPGSNSNCNMLDFGETWDSTFNIQRDPGASQDKLDFDHQWNPNFDLSLDAMDDNTQASFNTEIL